VGRKVQSRGSFGAKSRVAPNEVTLLCKGGGDRKSPSEKLEQLSKILFVKQGGVTPQLFFIYRMIKIS